ncbi:MAG TPA: FAD-binding oxidoreductase [Tepidiformaceae bacterium]|nr:FAD-binding oxidoreductase [Tepidiformaceae bacterium]
MPASQELLSRLVSIVGRHHVLTDPGLRAGYETDWTRRFHGESPAVVRPGSLEEVMAVVGACNEAGAGIVPQGGNTGLVGGGVPRNGEIVLSLRRLDSITAFDAEAGEVTAGAGVTLAALRETVRVRGWTAGVDLASRASATIGGMVATNAGGIRVLRYGAMRQQVLGIEAVLADGRVLRRLPGLLKDNSGYDIAQLLAGSEGTLSVITAVRLKLVPEQPRRAVALLAVENLAAALGVVSLVRRALPSLEAAEVFFPEGLELVLRHTGLPKPFAMAHPCYLLLESAGQHDESSILASVLTAAPGIRDSAIATGRAERERLWAYRERHTESISAEGVPHKLDVTLPLARLPEFEARVRGVLAAVEPAARPVLFGHAGDGNLHVNILGLAPGDERPDGAVLELVAGLGGSISAEHGIGIAKMPWLHLTRSEADREAMRSIKAALDPRGILNPGVIVPAL